MNSMHVFDFAEAARTGNGIKNESFPGEPAEDAFQTAEFKEARSGQCANNISAAAHSDDEGALPGARQIF
jgi:hypothetical protein